MLAYRAKKLANALNKTIMQWISCGSEIEVNDAIARNTRALLEVEIESVFPMELETTSFDDRKPQDCRDGYMKLEPPG